MSFSTTVHYVDATTIVATINQYDNFVTVRIGFVAGLDLVRGITSTAQNELSLHLNKVDEFGYHLSTDELVRIARKQFPGAKYEDHRNKVNA